jgi:DNA-binding transcriptional regulator YhcF (GntR family)
MSSVIQLHPASATPIYKQIVRQVEQAVRAGTLPPDTLLPSMNALAADYGISRETVKKAYGILRDRGLVEPRQGKGFYVLRTGRSAKTSVLVLFDNLSVYKQILFSSFSETLGPDAEITILTHDQSLDLFEYHLDNSLDRYDHYLVTPHFPLRAEAQKRALKLLRRIPNRKLILLDRDMPGLPGHFGSVYQDFSNDAYDALRSVRDQLASCRDIHVITLPESLYGGMIAKAVGRFGADHGIDVCYARAVPRTLRKGEVFMLLNSQLDSALVDLSRAADAQGLRIGEDIFVIAYNEFPLNEVVLGGLTTISTDFSWMGRRAAKIILTGLPAKERCPFRLTRRSTF